MATQSRQVDASKFECSICYNLLLDPVVGGCGHDFCKSCLDSWKLSQASSNADGNYRCPLCRKVLGATSTDLGVCVRLKELIEQLFPEDVERRREEVVGQIRAQAEARQHSLMQRERRATAAAADDTAVELLQQLLARAGAGTLPGQEGSPWQEALVLQTQDHSPVATATNQPAGMRAQLPLGSRRSGARQVLQLTPAAPLPLPLPEADEAELVLSLAAPPAQRRRLLRPISARFANRGPAFSLHPGSTELPAQIEGGVSRIPVLPSHMQQAVLAVPATGRTNHDLDTPDVWMPPEQVANLRFTMGWYDAAAEANKYRKGRHRTRKSIRT